ncbi:amino acid ABC transporter substrate-binding protein [Reyranella aquatilis]|uniref:Amino acid ABC transporter substrate-binding protein n=1 Tax=Reyranella aquatilis TaxID=2035356 RepID=A0ABS8KQR6_9HYPH|nr:amino acid ABC transporter substrate-binding protein [Reyranella aquatilis]MCC8428013.1 amino acid ABC transporter substrate-binding protein [Reyranella aquatilis]
MRERMGSWRRRHVLAGLLGSTAVLAAPAILRAAPSGKPVRVGGTLSLTGFLAQTAVIHKIASEIMVEDINSRDGFLGRPVEYVLLDDQSKPDVARSLYEKLITVDKVDLIQGPYATAPILAAMGVAQRYGKVIIQSSMGIPKLQTYDMAFPATPFGPEPDKTYPNVILDAMASLPTPPKSMVILTSKFPSAQFMAQGMKVEAEKRGVKVPLYLEYEAGNRDFGAIAARVKEANADFLWVGSLGLESNQILEALRKLDYTPKGSFHLYPAPGPLALSPDGNLAWSSTFLEPDEPFMSRPGVAKIAAAYKERATKANLPYPLIDAQAAGMVSEWQILEQGVNGAKSLEDKQIAAFLKKNVVNTIYGPLKFDGLYNHGAPAQLIRQVQNKEWKVVWPKEFAAPGVKLLP